MLRFRNRWLRVLVSVVVVLVIMTGIIAAIKTMMGGLLSPECYMLLMDFCHKSCWIGKPFSSFPLACDRTADAMVTVSVNLGVFILSWYMGVTFVMCITKICARVFQDSDYTRFRDETELESAIPSPHSTLRD